jgi:hypothetical protein
MDPILILIVYLLIFGVLSIVISKFMFNQHPMFVYAYFGFAIVMSQILDILFSIPISDNITITVGGIVSTSILLSTICIVINSQNPAIVRYVILIQLFLGLLIFLLTAVDIFSLQTTNIITFFSIPLDAYTTLILMVFINTVLYIGAILLLFFVLEKIKHKISSFVNRIVFLIITFVLILSIYGYVYDSIKYLLEPQITPSIIDGFFGYIILGVSFSPFLLLFILTDKTDFNIFIHQAFTIRSILSPKKEELMKELEEAKNEIRALQVLIPFCPSCKKVKDDFGYWDQLKDYIASHSMVKFENALCPDCMKQNHKLILSYFDMKMGPKVFLSAPVKQLEPPLNEIASMMDFNPNDAFFVHSIGNYDIANRSFSVDSEKARGKQIDMLLSYAVKKNYLDIEFAKNILKDFIPYIKNFKDIQTIFLNDPGVKSKDKKEKIEELETIFHWYFQSINEKKIRYYIDKISR